MTEKPLDAEGVPLDGARGKHDQRDARRAPLEPQADPSRVDDVAGDARVVEAGPEPPIRASDRVCAIGMTGSGKSQLLAHLWAIYPGQRILIDVTDACELGPDAIADERGYCRAEVVRDIDWRMRTVHFVPRAQSDRLYDDLYAAIFDRRDICVWLDEAYGPTTASRAPRWLGTVLRQGRKRNILHLAASQEPVNVLPVIYTQAEHLALFRLSGRPDELRALAPRFRLSADELAAELDRLPEHGFLRTSILDRMVRRKPPLPAQVIEHTRGHVTFV